MNCHLCGAELYIWKTYSWNNQCYEYWYDCREHNCKLHTVVQRCRLVYNPMVTKQYFVSTEFWIPEDKFWYQLLVDSNKSIVVNKISVSQYNRQDGSIKLSGSEPKEIFKLEQDFSILVKDNLPEKVPKLLKRIKNLIVFT